MSQTLPPHVTNRGGRPEYQPTPEIRRQVAVMSGFGLTQQHICDFLDIDRKTLRKHFRRELDVGIVEANMAVAQSLYVNATRNNNVAAQIWWTKARMGWKSTQVLEGNEDRPLMISFEWAPAKPGPVATASPTAPTIDAEASTTEPEDSDASGVVVTWQGGGK